MKKNIKIENIIDLKTIKQISAILLGLPEIDNLEADLDTNSIIISLNCPLSNEIIKYYISSTNNNILEISDIQ